MHKYRDHQAVEKLSHLIVRFQVLSSTLDMQMDSQMTAVGQTILEESNAKNIQVTRTNQRHCIIEWRWGSRESR